MIVLTGPSATGKTETALYLMKHYGLKKVITCTSRAPRKGEVNGVDYHFLTLEQFQEGFKNNEFLETATYNGNKYGTRKIDIGPRKISCLEPNGVASYKKVLKDKMFCAFLDASEATRLKRMVQIRKDGEKAADERILKDRTVYADDGEEVKKYADFILQTDGLTVQQEAEKVYQAYEEWLKTHQE